MNNNYSLRYLPIFYDDLKSITDYISIELKNPSAADKFIDLVEHSILNRLPFAESFHPYSSKRKRQYPYYKINVKNYIIFYVIITDDPANKIMEVRRILYNKRNWQNLI